MLKRQLVEIVKTAVNDIFKDANSVVEIEYPNEQAHGDYACNIAMKLTKQVGVPPREIAEKIVKRIQEKGDKKLVEKIEIAGPGFINFFISNGQLHKEVLEVLQEKEDYGKLDIGAGKTMICEYSSPNIAKPLGVHHLLSTIIGQSIYNMYKFIGYNAVSINHIGDWGTQFGKLIHAYKTWGNREVIEKNPIEELLKLYVRFHDEAEKDKSLEDRGREEFKKFEEGDKENRELWQWFVDESVKEMEIMYKKIGGIHFDFILGESFYEDKMEDILKEGKENEIFVKGEQGAYISEFEDENMAPLVVQKSDGATLYSTRDLATLKYRIDRWSPEKIVYVVDIAQTFYFKQLFKTAEKFPWYHGEGVHSWFGRMRMQDGKMSTRKGNVVLLKDVIDEAIKRAGKVNEKVAREVGLGAIKYNILSQNRMTDITFVWDKMLSFEGNSAPYLQYSYARAKSILRKAKEQGDEIEGGENTEAGFEGETLALVRMFPKFSEQVEMSAKEYKPNILANYIFELAQKFNSFYNKVNVLKEPDDGKRISNLRVVEATSQVIKNGLLLLGVEVVEEM